MKNWKRVFKPLNNQEIEIKNINVVNNVCTINYLMPYCTSSEEYMFQADIDKEKAVDGFCNTVEEKANEIIIMIRECSNIGNILKKDRYDKLNMKKKCNICGHIGRSRK